MRLNFEAPAPDEHTNLVRWRYNIATAAQAAMVEKDLRMTKEAVLVVAHFYLPRPKSLPKKVTDHIVSPDLIVLDEAVRDGIKGIVIIKKPQITGLRSDKKYTDPGTPAGVSILIEGADP